MDTVYKILNLNTFSQRQLYLSNNFIVKLWSHTTSPLFAKLKLGMEMWEKEKISRQKAVITPPFIRSFQHFYQQQNIQRFSRPPIYCTEYNILIYQINCDLTTFQNEDIPFPIKFNNYLQHLHNINTTNNFKFTDGSKTE